MNKYKNIMLLSGCINNALLPDYFRLREENGNFEIKVLPLLEPQDN